MSRDINGNYTLPPGINPVVAGTTIQSAWANPTMNDIASALSDSLSRSGLGGMLAPFKNADGSMANPGDSWSNEPTSGWYRKTTNSFAFAVGGVDYFLVSAATGVSVAAGIAQAWPLLSLLAGKGSIFAGTAAGVAGGLAVGVDGQVLTADSTQTTGLKWSSSSPAGSVNSDTSLVNLLYPSLDGAWRDIYRAGWLPWGFQQVWGGAQIGNELYNGADGIIYRFDSATGYVEANSTTAATDAAARTYSGGGFKVSESQSVAAIWLKLYKIGNPTNNISLRILNDDGTGTKPLNNVPITNGTATAVSMKLLESNPNGEWVRFVFPVSAAVIAGTVYQISISSSGAVDAANYIVILANNAKHYPFGSFWVGDAVPAFAATTTSQLMFMIENATANGFLQTGGIFDQKVVCYEGSPINQSKALAQPLRNFFDGKSFTCLIRGNFTKAKPIADFSYGPDHDRIHIRCNLTTGFAEVDLWNSAGVKVTVTATSVDVSAGNHDVGVKCRTVGDGADYLYLYVDGVQNGAPLTAQTFAMSTLMRELGTATIGGGFDLPPVWTLDTTMAALPSAGAVWTWTGTGTEASCMSVAGGRLFQNATGYGAAQTGYYNKAGLALSNANGWAVSWKARVPTSNNATTTFDAFVHVEDGTKHAYVVMHEFYVQINTIAATYNVQIDSKILENVFLFTGKGSDVYLYMNGRLVFDGTGLLTQASANNQIGFGDNDVTATVNADVVWDYLRYYNTAIMAPIFGASISEFAFWSGDKSSLLNTLYNAGTPQSVKAFCGVQRNYIGEPITQKIQQRGITSGITYTAATTAPYLLNECECFVLGTDIATRVDSGFSNATISQNNYLLPILDGAIGDYASKAVRVTNPVINSVSSYGKSLNFSTRLGLHKCDVRVATSGGTTASDDGTARTFQVEARP